MAEGTEIVVAIPTYNNGDTIGTTLEMLFAQRRLPDRVVFCDQSQDHTRDVIQEYVGNDEGVNIEILDQTGDGVADAYDQILDHVAGEYDLFVTLQSDLVVDEDWLAGHERLHEKHPEIDLVNGDNKARDPTDREVTPDERPYYVGRNFSAKAGALESIDGWDPNFLRGEDWDMRIRLAGQNVRSYACTDLGYTWQTEDPYITLSKAKRRPTAVSFLSKYGTWYLGFHPSHVVSDGLSLAAVVFGAVGLVSLPLSPLLGALSLSLLLVVVGLYTFAHNLLRGGVDGKRLVGPVRKQFLNGIAVIYALQRVVDQDVDWNRTGFDPENVPRYKF
ncbi:glycosyltransferase family A protein [Halobacteriales archaeon Cl-PHB]